MKKADIILLILIVAAGLIISFGPLAKEAGGTDVRVTLNGDTYGIYSLFEDQTIEIESDGHRNVIIIEDGTARMESSTCKNQICVDHGRISLIGDSIVCLPNRVVIEIEGKGGDTDVISG
ncbi:MAG: NusG domain II-containing protein [Firmicutes bacterium]|nr:NusG domain II-containing protein [Bacillota bacterium]